MAKDDDIDLSSLDMDFGDDAIDPSDSDDPGREVSGTKKSMIGKIGSELTDLDKHKDALIEATENYFNKSGLKEEFSGFKDIFRESKYAFEDSYESVKKELGGFTRTLRDLAPDILGIKTLLSKFVPDDDEYRAMSEARMREQEINTGVTSTLGSVEEFEEKIKEISEQVKEDVDKRTTNDILNDISSSARFSKFYSVEFTSKYYRKSLELQLRQTMLLKDILTVSQAAAVDNKNFLGGILKNTSLPDILKQRQLEMLGNDVKVKLREGFLNNFVMRGDIATKLRESITGRIKGYGNTIKSKIQEYGSVFEQMLEAKQQLAEYGQSPVDMAISAAAQAPINATHNFFLTRLLDKILSTKGGFKAAYMARNFIENPSGFFDHMRAKAYEDYENGKTGPINALKRLLFGELAAVTNFKNNTATLKYNKEDLEATASFDFRTKDTINKVIPKLLSRILTETKAHRLGMKEENLLKYDIEYDHVREVFATRSDIARHIKDSLRKSVRKQLSTSQMESALKLESFTKHLDSSVTEEDLKRLIDIAARVSIDVPNEGLGLFKSNEFNMALPDDFKEKHKLILDAMEKAYNENEAKGLKNEFVDQLRYGTNSLRMSIPNSFSIIQEYIKSGNIEALKNLNILRKDELSGLYRADRNNAIAYMFKDFDLHEKHKEIKSNAPSETPVDTGALMDILSGGLDAAKDFGNYVITKLPPKTQTHVNAIVEGVKTDVSKLSTAGEQKLFDGIDKLDEYMSSGEYKKLPEEAKDKILEIKEAGRLKMEEIYQKGKGKAKETFTKKNVRGTFKRIGGWIKNTFTKENAVNLSKATVKEVKDKYQEYTNAYKAEGVKGLGKTAKSDFTEIISTANEKTLKKLYDKLPEDLKKELEIKNKKQLVNKDYYINALAAIGNTIPESYRKKLFGNDYVQALKSGVSGSETLKALKGAGKDALDTIKEKVDNSTIINKSKEIITNIKDDKQVIKDKLDLLDLLADAVKARSPEMIDEVEQLIKEYKFDDDTILMDNVKKARYNLESGKTFAGKALNALAKITDPVEYASKAGQLFGSFWNYVPMGSAIKFMGMGIGGYIKALRKADRWFRDQLFMAPLRLMGKVASPFVNTGLGLGGLGLGLLSKTGMLGGRAKENNDKMLKYGKKKLYDTYGMSGMGGFLLKGLLGTAYGLPLGLAYNGIKAATNFTGHLLGLDIPLRAAKSLVTAPLGKLFNKRRENMQLDTKTSYLLKRSKEGISNKMAALFGESEEERQDRLKEMAGELFERLTPCIEEGDIPEEEGTRLLQALTKDTLSEDELNEIVATIEASELNIKKKKSIVRKFVNYFKVLTGKIGFSLKSAAKRIKNWLVKKFQMVKRGLGGAKSMLGKAFSKTKEGVANIIGGVGNYFKDKKKKKEEKAKSDLASAGKEFFKSLSSKGQKQIKKNHKSQGTSMELYEWIGTNLADLRVRYKDEIRYESDSSIKINGLTKAEKEARDEAAEKKKEKGFFKSVLSKAMWIFGLLGTKFLPSFSTLVKLTGTIKSAFTSVKFWKDKFSYLLGGFTKIIKDFVWKPLKTTFGLLKLVGGSIMEYVRISSLKKFGQSVTGLAKGVWNGTKNAVVKGVDLAVNTTKAVANKVGKWCYSIKGKVIDVGQWIMKLKSKLGTGWEKFSTTVGNILKNAKSTVPSMLNKAKTASGKKLSKKAIGLITKKVVARTAVWFSTGIVSGLLSAGVGTAIVYGVAIAMYAYNAVDAYLNGSSLLGAALAGVLGFDPLREFSDKEPELTETEEDEDQISKTSPVKFNSDFSNPINRTNPDSFKITRSDRGITNINNNGGNTKNIYNNMSTVDTSPIIKEQSSTNEQLGIMNETQNVSKDLLMQQNELLTNILKALTNPNANKADMTSIPNFGLTTR